MGVGIYPFHLRGMIQWWFRKQKINFTTCPDRKHLVQMVADWTIPWIDILRAQVSKGGEGKTKGQWKQIGAQRNISETVGMPSLSVLKARAL